MRNFITGLMCAALASGCGKGDSQDDTGIDVQPLSRTNPQAPVPTVDFPRELQTDDSTLNKFIQDALGICAIGDYDHFRQLFGSAYNPPAREAFNKIWAGVKHVEIVSVHSDFKEPPTYYVHAVVHLRQPDPHRHTQRRDAVVAVFREEGQWRMAPAPNEFIHKVLVVDSQPANGSASRPASRPSSAMRPASHPGV